MKKNGLVFVMVMFAFVAKAQVYVAGSTSFWSNDDANTTTFSIAPEVGYNLNEKWAVGASFGFVHSSDDDFDVSSNAVVFNPYARYSFYENKVVRLFVDGGLGISSVKVKDNDSEAGFEFGLKPGIAIKLSKHFSVLAKCGFVGYRDDYALGGNGYGFALTSEDLSFGVHYEF